MSFRRSLFFVVAILAALLVTSASASASGGLKVVADGLDNPRGLDIGRFGAVYVAEAGKGGSGPCRQGPEGGEECYGATGAVTRIWHDHQRRVLRGLPSLAGSTGEAATGPQDISIGPFGAAYLVVGWGGDPAGRAALAPVGQRFGKLYRATIFSGPRSVADLAAYEGQRQSGRVAGA